MTTRRVVGVTIEAEPDLIFGAQGLERVHYNGAMSGKWKGAVTCTLYPFGPSARVRWVDKRDTPSLLAFADAEGHKMFAKREA